MKRAIAVFTIAQNEPVFLPLWSRYYRSQVPAADLFVLDHDSTDARTAAAARGLNRVPVHREESFNHRWLREVVERFQAFLLESYERVLFTEVDEIVAPDPLIWPGGLSSYLRAGRRPGAGYVRCTGYEIVHRPGEGEPALDWERPVLSQRRFCRRSEKYSKPLLASRPLAWDIGFHRLRAPQGPVPAADPELLLLHLHRVDYDTCRTKTLESASRRWSASDYAAGAGYQNRIVDAAEFEHWFHHDFYDESHDVEPIPERWESIV